MRQRDLLLELADIGAERLRHDHRLLENLLLHEVAVIALLDLRRAGAGIDDRPLDRLVVAVEDLHLVMGDDGPVALVQIGDAAGERGERERVGAEIILALAIADGERRPEPGADDQAGMVAEQDGEREGAVQARQDGGDGGFRDRRPAAAGRRPDGRRPRCRSGWRSCGPWPASPRAARGNSR